MKNNIVFLALLAINFFPIRGEINDLPFECVGKIVPKHASEIRSSPWSVGCEALDRDFAVFEEYENYVGRLGVKHARLQSGWAKCEKIQGTYNFVWLDSCVLSLKRQGVQPWICLSYGNPIYNCNFEFGAKIFIDENTMVAWLNYVKAIVGRYKDEVTEWEIWNEPMPDESPEAYADLLIQTENAIKQIQPSATVIGFTVHGFTSTVLDFPRLVFEVLKERGKCDIVDYVSYHPYTYNPDECYHLVDDLKEMVVSYVPNALLYQGESGAPSEYSLTKALNKYEWTELSQAKWNLRRMLGDYARGIRTSIFTMVDLKYDDEFNRKGLLYAKDNKTVDHPKLSYLAIQHLTACVDSTFLPQGLLQYMTNGTRSLTVAGFEKKNKQMVAFWFDDKIPTDEWVFVERELFVEAVRFKRPMLVNLLTGKVYKIEVADWKTDARGTFFKKLPVWDSPMLIVEKSQVYFE